MHMLLQLARAQNKTVITSIHQPNSALFHSFDKLIMLAEGNVVYFGTPRDSLAYLRDCKLACPDGYNAADHWMDLLVHDTAIEETTMASGSSSGEEPTERSGGTLLDDTSRSANAILASLSEEGGINGTTVEISSGAAPSTTDGNKRVSIQEHSLTTRAQLIRAWDKDAIAAQMDSATLNSDDDDVGGANSGSYSKYNTSWGMQYRVLVHRSLKNSRSAIFTPINLIKSGAIALVSGALWFQMDYTEANVYDLSSYFFFTMTYWVVSQNIACSLLIGWILKHNGLTFAPSISCSV